MPLRGQRAFSGAYRDELGSYVPRQHTTRAKSARAVMKAARPRSSVVPENSSLRRVSGAVLPSFVTEYTMTHARRSPTRDSPTIQPCGEERVAPALRSLGACSFAQTAAEETAEKGADDDDGERRQGEPLRQSYTKPPTGFLVTCRRFFGKYGK